MPSKAKTPWPTKAVMQQIYELHLWGGKEVDFYSGEGSHNPAISKPYIDAVIDFLNAHNNSLVVCDLGCGDFNIGKHLVEHSKKYIAVDIVDELIERNKALFKADNLAFYSLDIAKNELPKADCVIVRQTLQHLSNTEILSIVNKLSNYKYIILTEHLPLDTFTPNKNKISGQGIRINQNSGVNLLEKPFYLSVVKEDVLNEIILENNKGLIKTILYTCF